MIIYSGCKSTKKISFTLRFYHVFFEAALVERINVCFHTANCNSLETGK